MIPKGPDAIRNLVARIGMDLIPKAGDAYTATDLVYFTVLLGMVAQDYDRAAEVLVDEHAALVPIFRGAAANIADAALGARIAAALAMEPASLRVRDLNARSDILLKLLINVHAAVEEAEGGGADWARRLNGKIWAFLDTHVTAHAYDVPI
jgi:hypothetical protein